MKKYQVWLVKADSAMFLNTYKTKKQAKEVIEYLKENRTKNNVEFQIKVV